MFGLATDQRSPIFSRRHNHGTAGLHFLVIVPLVFIAQTTSANYIGNIQFEFPTHSYLAFGTQAHVTFDYNITEPGGARIAVRPMTGGSDTPNYIHSGSGFMPAGSGSAERWLSITSGDVVVDHYRLAMYSYDWSELLLEIMLPMTYYFNQNGAFNIRPSHTQPSWLGSGEQLSFEIDTEVADPAGAMLFVRPFTAGAPTPGYSATSAVCPYGFGTTSQHFTFNGVDRDVDHIRVMMTNIDQSVTYLEFFVPVDYHWRAHGFSNFILSPPPPAWLPRDYPVHVYCDYVRNDPGEYIQIFAIGYFEGSIMEEQGYANSGPLYDMTGEAEMRIRYLGDGQAECDEIRLRMRDDAMIHLLQEQMHVEYHFGQHAIYNIVTTPPAPTVLSHDERVYLDFEYTTIEAGGVRIFVYPYTDGEQSPDYVETRRMTLIR